MRKQLVFNAILYSILVALISVALIAADAFEELHEFSRSHESWELDEVVLVLFSALVVGSIWVAVIAVRRGRTIQIDSEARLAAEQELNAARHAQSLGILAGGLAHSGNNFLQPILTLSRLGQQKLEDDHPVAEYLRKISLAAENAAELFSSVLRFGRPSGQASDSIEVFSTIRELIKILRLSLPSGIELEEQFTGGPAGARISEQSLLDILLVLLSNAADAYQGGPGIVRLSVRTAAANDQQDATIQIAVSDDGIGISTENQGRIFDPFFTTKEVGQGTGLGLSVVDRLVADSGGILSLESALGNGTRITVSLPVADERKPKEV